MTLPITLMPSGVIVSMRVTASSFMTTPAVLYEVTTSYSIYGEPVLASGVLWSGLIYIGKVSARDLDLLRRSDFYVSRNDGREIKYLSTILLPFKVEIEDYNVLKVDNVDWEVIWDSNETSDAVQVYTKVIARNKRYG